MSMAQALAIWTELERAYFDKNGFGGNKAELYAYRFVPYCPAAANQAIRASNLAHAAVREQAQLAWKGLVSILGHFGETHEDVKIFVNDKPFDDFKQCSDKKEFHHRVHVRIER